MKHLILFLFLSHQIFAQGIFTLLGDDAPILTATANLQLRFEDPTSTSTWADLSGNNRTMTLNGTPTLNIASINSKNSLTFDGATENGTVSAFTLNQPITVYMVVKQITWTSGDGLIDGNTNLSTNINSTPSTPSIALYAGTGNAAANTGLTLGVWKILTVEFNGASSLIQINDGTATTGNPGANNAGGFTLASRKTGSNSNIEVAAVLVYSGAHDLATRTLVKAYLNAKYKVY